MFIACCKAIFKVHLRSQFLIINNTSRRSTRNSKKHCTLLTGVSLVDSWDKFSRVSVLLVHRRWTSLALSVYASTLFTRKQTCPILCVELVCRLHVIELMADLLGNRSRTQKQGKGNNFDN